MQNNRHSQVYSVIKVDAIPPSVNSYVRHTRSGNHFETRKARAFKQALGLQCKMASPVYGKEFEVKITIMLGSRQKGDLDNFLKLPLDTIARAGMLRNMKTGVAMSDSHVTRLTVTKERGERSMTTIEIIGVNS